jgi:ribosome recycling factor
MSTDPRISSFLQEIEKVKAHLLSEYVKLQTGRPNTALVDHIHVDAYGSKQELRTVAGVTIDGRSIVIQAWDRSILGAIEKALQQANIGVNPVNDGVVIRINLPPLTEERRIQLTKVVHQLAEEAKISVRKHRQTSLDSIKAEKDEDVRRTLEQNLQKAVDDANGTIAEMAKKKEQEVMTV